MTLPNEYVQLLQDCGLSLHTLNPGSQETALDRNSALEALRILSNYDISVLGGDVLEKNRGALQYTYANWYCTKHESEVHKQFARRSQRQAITYISKFIPTSGCLPFFVLVLDL
jgi:hypothetical protein